MAQLATSQNGWPVHTDAASVVPLSWITGRVDPRVHDLFDRLCARFHADVEPIIRAHSWGWANRPIRGSSVISNHASGTAIDLNAPAHPLGASGTFTAAQVRAIKAILGDFPQVRWGGLYVGRKDEMHFEINVRPEAFSMAVPRMVSPTEGRFTSAYGKRNFAASPFHAGIDIAPPTPGQSGRAVYAAFAGKVSNVVHGRYLGQPASSGTVVAPGRSGNGLRVRNPDGEQQIYIHVNAVVKNGQSVKAGELLGHTDRSGIQTGPHLHFETWNAAGHTYNPALLFKKYGVGIGSRPAHTPSKNPPDKTPTTPTAPKEWDQMATKKEIQDALWEVLNRDITTPAGNRPLYGLIRDGSYALAAAKDAPTKVWSQELGIGGATKAALGRDTLSSASLLRYAAAAAIEGRNQHADLRARLAGLQAALHELATTKGIDADKVDAAINKAVKDALADLKITLTTED